jgi:hypothetical protein
MDVVEDSAQRALLAEALLAETHSPTEELVCDALAWHEANIIEQQLRQVRSDMAERERQMGWEEALKLNESRASLERRLSELKAHGIGRHGQ